MTSTILIVDDEQDLANAVEYNLQREGFRTRIATTGMQALEALSAARPDLVILDLMLPDISGTEVCRKLRSAEATHAIPVLMLTARGEEIDRVVGFEVGADDYMTKPFSMRELVLRVRAILRRSTDSEEPKETSIQFGVIKVDVDAHRTWIDGNEVRLTALEFKLLNLFLSRRGRVQTRESLLADVWGIAVDVTTRTVDTHVKRLREKLGAAGMYIETIRGVGYRFLADERDLPKEAST
jgi:two-component system phosphate regulon response regulator PhoB